MVPQVTQDLTFTSCPTEETLGSGILLAFGGNATGTGGFGGGVHMQGGTGYQGGDARIYGGASSSAGGSGGPAGVQGGAGTGGAVGGFAYAWGGSATGAKGGDLYLAGGLGSPNGNILLVRPGWTLPTSDPGIAGALFATTVATVPGVVQVSAGP